MKELIKATFALIVYMLPWLPCLCTFSEGDNILVNVFGAVYTIIMVKIYNSTPEKKKAVKSWLKSIIRLNPDINRI